MRNALCLTCGTANRTPTLTSVFSGDRQHTSYSLVTLERLFPIVFVIPLQARSHRLYAKAMKSSRQSAKERRLLPLSKLTVLAWSFVALWSFGRTEAIRLTDECKYGQVSSPSNGSANQSFLIGGLFSAHQMTFHSFSGAQQCSVKDPAVAESFHRFAVEQTEALLFATEFGYSVFDTCGDLPPTITSECAEDQAEALANPDDPAKKAAATILGPYYHSHTAYVESHDLQEIYEKATGSQIFSESGVLSLVDEPINIIPLPAVVSLAEYVVVMQPSCDMQARAVVDFIVSAGWKEISLVASGDQCGFANLVAFRNVLTERRLDCEILAEYYYLGSIQRSEYGNFTAVFSSDRLWKTYLPSPRAVIFLGSVADAFDVFDFYVTSIQNKELYDFFVGDLWGSPGDIDGLYNVLKTVAATARTVVALRTVTKGLEKFQEHMTSIRANSPELQRNSILKRYWEVTFNCSVASGTCSNETALPAINRPILQNYKAALVIDGVFLIAAYLEEFLREFPFESPYFSTHQSIFFSADSDVTNVTSWTGNQVRLGYVVDTAHTSHWRRPVTWSFDILVLTENQSVQNQYGVWTYYGRINEAKPSLSLTKIANTTIRAWPLKKQLCPQATKSGMETPSDVSTTSGGFSKIPILLHVALSVIILRIFI